MAEPNEVPNTLPQKGKVEAVCRQWSVHEDGAKAYHMQNEEFDFHYGLNRKNRRTVREDIPVAKIVQSEEEKRLQEERYRHLQQLKAQAEEDERVAQQMNVELEVQDIQRQKIQEVKDQEIALQMQEKEKKKYEKYLEKKKEKHLQKQRENLERELAQHTEEARLVLSSERGNAHQLGDAMEDLNLGGGPRGTTNGHARYKCRVMPSGHIEDDGDFTDFYVIPDEVTNNPETRRVLQEQQDEELARLLQEQEHKRTKAEVDRGKLRKIEARDEQLARVIQEQEKLKAKKAKQRRQQLREQQRQQQMATDAMASGMNMSAAVAAVDPLHANGEMPAGHRYRRDSYTRSISNTNDPGPVHHQAIAKQSSSPPSLPPREPPSYEMHKRIQMQNARVLGRPLPADMSPDELGEVERWLEGTSPHHMPSNAHPSRRISDDHLPPSPSPPGSYHSEEDESRSFSPDASVGSGHAVSTPMQFNIAAAIDPTYRRRQQEIQHIDQTEVKSQIPLSRSLPLSDESAGTMSTLGHMEEEPGPDGPVMSPWQPVQGQKRTTLDKQRRSKKSSPNQPMTKKDSKGSCKQQ